LCSKSLGSSFWCICRLCLSEARISKTDAARGRCARRVRRFSDGVATKREDHRSPRLDPAGRLRGKPVDGADVRAAITRRGAVKGFSVESVNATLNSVGSKTASAKPTCAKAGSAIVCLMRARRCSGVTRAPKMTLRTALADVKSGACAALRRQAARRLDSERRHNGHIRCAAHGYEATRAAAMAASSSHGGTRAASGELTARKP